MEILPDSDSCAVSLKAAGLALALPAGWINRFLRSKRVTVPCFWTGAIPLFRPCDLRRVIVEHSALGDVQPAPAAGALPVNADPATRIESSSLHDLFRAPEIRNAGVIDAAPLNTIDRSGLPDDALLGDFIDAHMLRKSRAASATSPTADEKPVALPENAE